MKTNKENVTLAAAKVFIQKGYNGCTLRDIALEAKLSNGSCLFNYFKGKEDLYRTILEKYVIQTQTPKQKFGDCSGLSLKEFIELYVERVGNTIGFMHDLIDGGNKTANRYLSFILESGYNEKECDQCFFTFNDEELKLWQSVIERAKENGEVLPHINPSETAKLFRYAFVGLTFVCAVGNGANLKQVRDTLYSVYKLITP